jgi:hypothetical protein
LSPIAGNVESWPVTFSIPARWSSYTIWRPAPAADQIVNAAGNVVRVSRLTVAELTSAFAIKVRTRSISRQDADLFLQQFRRDNASGKLEMFSIAETEFAKAESLVERYAFDRRLRAPNLSAREAAERSPFRHRSRS